MAGYTGGLLGTPDSIVKRRVADAQQTDAAAPSGFDRAGALLSNQDTPYGGQPYGQTSQYVNPLEASVRQHLQNVAAGQYAPSPNSVKMSAVAGGGGDIDRFMGAVREVESGGNYTVRNSIGASGAYQFMDPTWGGYGGYKRASDAPPAVQDARARQLMQGYYNQFHDWRLVAIAWLGGPGLAAKVQQNPSAANVGDGNISAGNYAARVLNVMGNLAGPSAPPAAPTTAGSVRVGSGQSWANLRPVAQMRAALVLGRFPQLTFTSGWRSAQHNAEVGGVANSDHLTGLATDMVADMGTMQAAAAFASSIGGHPLIHDAGSGMHLHINWS